MPSPDLDALARVSYLSATRSPSGPLRACVAFILIFLFALAGAALGGAQEQTQQNQTQSVAEAARQERSRKQSLEKRSKHVYTAEDLKRAHILTPQDRGALEARKNQPATAPGGPQKLPEGGGATIAEDAYAASPSANSARVPLGDLARRLRREKESQQLQRSSEFHLPFADAPVLASPKPPAQPLLPSVTVAPPTVVLPPRVVAPWRPFVKRSPFERPRVLPAPPVATRRFAPTPPALSPAPRTPRVLAAQPTARVTASGKLMVVTVKAGDSLWKVAAVRLGDGRRWQELLRLNPGLPNPDRLEVGTQMVVPASLAPPRPRTKYAVRHGETLWTIAQTQLGQGTAWSCIAHANPDLGDANLIHEGQLLQLPASCSP